MDTEYIYPTKNSRLRVITKLLSFFLFVAAIPLSSRAYFLHTAALSFCDQVPWIRLLLLFYILIILVPATLLARKGWQAYKHKQYPPPGTAVFFRTKVQRGWLAAISGLSTLGLSGMLFFLLAGITTSEVVSIFFFNTNPCGA